jgi:deoxycytidylate deaminase
MERKFMKNSSKTALGEGSCIILGFTGSLGSGCTFLSEGIKGILGREFGHHYILSNFLREEGKIREITETVENLQTLGDKLRNKYGLDILVRMCIDKINNDVKVNNFISKEDTVIIIDGIKNTGEIKYLRQFPNFYLVSVYSDRDVRKGRIVGPEAKKKRFKTEKDFESADNRDEEEDIPNGQQIKQCNYLSDIIINNNKDFSDAEELHKTGFFNRFIQDYIYPMRKVRKGETPHDRPPKIEETLMTMAYCESKRSSCIKRKVGAVIAYMREFDRSSAATPSSSNRDLQFQVVSTGYNDIPVGTPCIFSEWEGCYREYLQEQHAKKLLFCPNCGNKIPDLIKCLKCGEDSDGKRLLCKKCKRDILSDYKCSKCRCEIFKTFLPGKDITTGKLLDMCRSLHTEENAILGLSGISKMEDGELILFTTTFPCNLCANKIVASGIKKVYYAEAYTQKESYELLKKCNIKMEKFQGIKSSAYFRLYS